MNKPLEQMTEKKALLEAQRHYPAYSWQVSYPVYDGQTFVVISPNDALYLVDSLGGELYKRA